MLSRVSARFIPRSTEANAQARRYAALRAEMTDLAAQVEKLKKDHDTTLLRMAQIQQELDDIKQLLKKLTKQ